MAPPNKPTDHLLDPVERELLGEGQSHVLIVESVHRSFLWLHGLGGLCALVGAVAVPAVVSVALEGRLGVFQLALVAVGALIVGLTLLRVVSSRVASRHRGQVRAYCAQHGVTVEELVALSARLGPRWFFFRAVWQGAPSGQGLDIKAPN